ncbi:MAG: hypothetical protein QME89_03825 [Actinomycetota bacterium]|jgi:hypothetical protein|nr:hypothetical protein [Actinomycetota bacterium]
MAGGAREMKGWKTLAKGILTASLAALLLLALLALPAKAVAAEGVKVKVSIAPCVRVRADGTLQSNIPAVTQEEGGLLLTVTAR